MFFLKSSNVSHALNSAGNLLHRMGPFTEIERSPAVTSFNFGVCNFIPSLFLVVLTQDFITNNSLMYSSARLFSALYTIMRILYWILDFIGSQWSNVHLLESYYLIMTKRYSCTPVPLKQYLWILHWKLYIIRIQVEFEGQIQNLFKYCGYMSK